MTRAKIIRSAALLLAATLVGMANAATGPTVVKGFARIGTFQVQGGVIASARSAFGTPSGQTQTSSDCTLRWPGLTISFYTLANDKQCGSHSAFGEAKIAGPWVTDRGLRQGDPVSRAKQLYADARKPGSSTASSIGLIVKTSPAIGDYGLSAVVAHGRLTALLIEDPQGGE